jgi:hypothetical protein
VRLDPTPRQPAGDLGRRLSHPDGTPEQVEPRHFERDQLARAQPGVGREANQGRIRLRDHLGQHLDLDCGEEVHLLALYFRRLHPSGDVARQPAAVDRAGEDLTERAGPPAA